MKIDVLIKLYPELFHMAEPGTWESIRKHGLLSTSALLDRADIEIERRMQLEMKHRPEKAKIQCPEIGVVVLRDQKPMIESQLKKALQDDLTPRDWYSLLNSKVFLWATQDRLNTLLNAKSYRNEEHDVLTLDSAQLLNDHWESVALCHMNSGNTRPFPHPRGKNTFLPIADYPTTNKDRPVKPIVEVTVSSCIPNVFNYVKRVDRMRGGAVIENLYVR